MRIRAKRALGVTRQTISKRLHALGMTFPVPPDRAWNLPPPLYQFITKKTIC